jgi:hypothetical protein
MSDMRLDAYYYGFTRTGHEGIDRILSAVACAGKAFHHTNQWTDEVWDGTPRDKRPAPYEPFLRGWTPVEWIQNAANDAAALLAAESAARREGERALGPASERARELLSERTFDLIRDHPAIADTLAHRIVAALHCEHCGLALSCNAELQEEVAGHHAMLDESITARDAATKRAEAAEAALEEERKRTAWHWHHIAQYQGERAEKAEAALAEAQRERDEFQRKYHEAMDVLTTWGNIDSAEAVARALQSERSQAQARAALVACKMPCYCNQQALRALLPTPGDQP